jgi:hypothetical protein
MRPCTVDGGRGRAVHARARKPADLRGRHGGAVSRGRSLRRLARVRRHDGQRRGMPVDHDPHRSRRLATLRTASDRSRHRRQPGVDRSAGPSRRAARGSGGHGIWKRRRPVDRVHGTLPCARHGALVWPLHVRAARAAGARIGGRAAHDRRAGHDGILRRAGGSGRCVCGAGPFLSRKARGVARDGPHDARMPPGPRPTRHCGLGSAYRGGPPGAGRFLPGAGGRLGLPRTHRSPVFAVDERGRQRARHGERRGAWLARRPSSRSARGSATWRR